MKNILSVIVVALVLVAVVTGCGGMHRYDARLAAADSLMHDVPDSALALVQAVDPASLTREGDRAYRDLLLTQARYRCYITATSDSDINRALAYYRHHDSEREKLTRAYIYKGAVMEELGHPDSAMLYYKQAEAIADEKDYANLGYVKMRIGTLYTNYYSMDGNDIKKYEEALMCYNNTNDTTSLFLCMNNLGCLYRETNPEKAVQLLQKASFIAKELKDTSFIISNNHALLVQYFYYGRFEEAHALIPQIISCLDQIKDYQLLFLISNVYSRIHVLDSAQFYINKAIINHERDSMPYYQMYFFESLGEYELAKGDTLASLNYHQKSEQIASTLKSNNIKLNILDTEKQFDNDQYVRNRLKSRKLRTSLNIFIAFFLLTVICFACYYYYKKHRYDNLINELKQEYQNQANNLISLHNSIKELKICDENLKDFITSHTTLMQKVLEACYQAPKNVLGKEIKQIVLFQDKNKNNWEKLYHYIDAQYNDIMKTTKQNYPQLNDKDLLLIALTCLGFSYIQIAIIMGYSNHTSISVLKKRLAIKMKLENSINDYISSFI